MEKSVLPVHDMTVQLVVLPCLPVDKLLIPLQWLLILKALCKCVCVCVRARVHCTECASGLCMRITINYIVLKLTPYNRYMHVYFKTHNMWKDAYTKQYYLATLTTLTLVLNFIQDTHSHSESERI